MPNELGFYDSPGERLRRERFQQRRAEVLDTFLPMAVEGLGEAAASTDQSLTELSQAQGMFNLQPPRIRSAPPAGLEGLRDRPLREVADIIGLSRVAEQEGLTPQALLARPRPTEFEQVGFQREVELEAGRALEELAPSPGILGAAKNATVGLAQMILEAEALERKTLGPATRPIGRAVTQLATEAVIPQVPRPLRALGVSDFPGREKVREVAGEVGEEIGEFGLVPSNLIPIPIADDILRILAKGLPIAARLLTRTGRQATRAELSELAAGARRFLTRTPPTEPAERRVVEQAVETLAPARAVPGEAPGVLPDEAQLAADQAGRITAPEELGGGFWPWDTGRLKVPEGLQVTGRRRIPPGEGGGEAFDVRHGNMDVTFNPNNLTNEVYVDIKLVPGTKASLRNLTELRDVLQRMATDNPDVALRGMFANDDLKRLLVRKGGKFTVGDVMDLHSVPDLGLQPVALRSTNLKPWPEALAAPARAAGEVAEAVPAAPVEPPGPPAQTATGGELPGRGNAGAKAALALKEETLLRPGRLTQLPGIKQLASGLSPSVSIDRNVLVSYNARQAVTASLETEFAALRRPVIQRLQGAWDAQPPTYTGPKANAMKNTIKDWADNPDFYAAVSPELSAAGRAYDDVSNQILARTRGEFGVDINAFSSAKAGSFYLPTVQARETLDDALLRVSQGYTSSGVPVSSARAKARVYEGAYQRSVKNPDFRAETDLAELTGLHDRAMATMGGNETFRLGAGGRTKLDVMQELKPELASRMIFLRQRLTNLRSQAGRLSEKARGAIDEFLANPDGNLSDLADALDVRVTRGRLKGADIKGVNAEIKSVRQEVRALRPAWESANLEPFVLNRNTFRYHEAEQSAAVDRILQTKLPMGEGLLQAIDEVRLFAFAGDVSPLTIQGLLGVLSDPITGARSLPRVMQTLLSPEELLRVAGREPELVARFTQATGRPFGELGGEFVQARRGIERIPVVGPELNRRLMSAVEMLRYNQWKTDTALLQRLNPGMTEAVADAEAANALSKIIPALNPAERGASRLQARLERAPVISTSFIGGPATVIKDATSGVVKLTASRSLSPAARWQALAGREQLAILHLTSISGTIATAAVGSHILSGWSPEDAVKEVLDPNSPRFLSVALGPERRIPIGGPLRSAVKAFVPQKVGEVKGVPVYVPFRGVPQWLRAKGTPALKAPFDLARNADYFGGKIATGSFPEKVLRTLWYAANNVLPLAIAEPSEAIRRGEVEPTEIGRLAERAGAQLAGVDLRETSRFEEFRLAFRDEIGRDYDGTEAARKVAQGNDRLGPMLEALEKEALERGFEGAVRRDERAQALAELTEPLRPFIEGVRARQPDAGPKLVREYSTLGAQSFALSVKDALGVEFPDPSTDLGRLVEEYYDLSLEVDPDTLLEDYATLNSEQDRILEEIGKIDPRVTEALQVRAFRFPEEFRDVELELQAVAELRNQLRDIPQFRGISVERKREIDQFLRRVRTARDRIKDEKGPDSPDVPTMDDAIESAGRAMGKDSRFVLEARALQSTSARQRLLNVDYVRFIVDNADQLLYFYPELKTDTIRRVLAGS